MLWQFPCDEVYSVQGEQRCERSKGGQRLYTYVMAWVGTLGMVLMTRSLVELYWLYVEE
jgi:hypothetical protein